MEVEAKKESLIQLGVFFRNCIERYNGNEVKVMDSELEKSELEMGNLIDRLKHENAWFTSESVLQAIEAWSNSLTSTKIETWLNQYNLEKESKQKVGVIMAGNIPLVGLHDSICVLLSGGELHAKLSTKDSSLMGLTLNVMGQISNEFRKRIKFVQQLKDVDVLIATGSDNSARYFDYYFKDKKRIIRKNRTSVALLNGEESEEDLVALSNDVFTHFGLGCRNVTKVYIPKGFDLDRLFNAFYPYREIVNHNKYANNYDYNKAVYLLNKIELIENGFILLKEDEGIHSPVGVLFYEYYDDIAKITQKLLVKKDQLQCIVSNSNIKGGVGFGKAQSPEIWDYADGIDTLEFLLN